MKEKLLTIQRPFLCEITNRRLQDSTRIRQLTAIMRLLNAGRSLLYMQ